jgi:hypothetical protein
MIGLFIFFFIINLIIFKNFPLLFEEWYLTKFFLFSLFLEFGCIINLANMSLLDMIRLLIINLHNDFFS